MTDDDGSTVTTGELARLLDVTPKSIADLAKRGIIEHAGRGRRLLRASVAGYCRHLREQAAGRGDWPRPVNNCAPARAHAGRDEPCVTRLTTVATMPASTALACGDWSTALACGDFSMSLIGFDPGACP